MAQNILIKYKGAKAIKANTPVLGSSFPTATALIMKTEGVNASVNGTDAFPVQFNDISVMDTSATYTFTKDCVVAFGDYVAV